MNTEQAKARLKKLPAWFREEYPQEVARLERLAAGTETGLDILERQDTHAERHAAQSAKVRTLVEYEERKKASTPEQWREVAPFFDVSHDRDGWKHWDEMTETEFRAEKATRDEAIPGDAMLLDLPTLRLINTRYEPGTTDGTKMMHAVNKAFDLAQAGGRFYMPSNTAGIVDRTPEQRDEIATRFLAACDAAIDVTEHIEATLSKVETMRATEGIEDTDLAQVIRGRFAELAQLGDKCDAGILDPLHDSATYQKLERVVVDVGLASPDKGEAT